MKRYLLLLSVFLTLGVARADDASGWVKSGMEGLKAANLIHIDLAGTTTLGTDTSGLRCQVLYKLDYDSDNKARERLECTNYVDGVLTQRIVGDGTNLWSYDPIANTYSVMNYGSYTSTPDANSARKLFQGFMNFAKGQSVWLARLMLDSKGYDDVKYTPWIPSATGEVTDLTSVVRSRYLDGNPFKKILTYLTNREAVGGYTLSSVGYWENVLVGSKIRNTQWVAPISTTVANIDDSHFVFTPPNGAKPLVKS